MKIKLAATNVALEITNNADEVVLSVNYDNYAATIDVTKLIEGGVDLGMLIKQVSHNETMQSIKNGMAETEARAEARKAANASLNDE